MSCNSQLIPEYLHWNNRKQFQDTDYLDEHRLYRVGNPIEFPAGTITAFSCKWSCLIKEEDVLNSNDPPIGDDYQYCLIESLRQNFLKKEKTEGTNQGWHKLSCKFEHSPSECDYSHTHVLIRHEIYHEQEEINKIEEHVYTYNI